MKKYLDSINSNLSKVLGPLIDLEPKILNNKVTISKAEEMFRIYEQYDFIKRSNIEHLNFKVAYTIPRGVTDVMGKGVAIEGLEMFRDSLEVLQNSFTNKKLIDSTNFFDQDFYNVGNSWELISGLEQFNSIKEIQDIFSISEILDPLISEIKAMEKNYSQGFIYDEEDVNNVKTVSEDIVKEIGYKEINEEITEEESKNYLKQLSDLLWEYRGLVNLLVAVSSLAILYNSVLEDDGPFWIIMSRLDTVLGLLNHMKRQFKID